MRIAYLTPIRAPIDNRALPHWWRIGGTVEQHPYYPDVLVTSDQLAATLDEGIVIVEIDLDPFAYDQGHIPGAQLWDWEKDLRDQDTQEVLSRSAFCSLMERSGITPETKVYLYGDNNNWFACWGFWLMKMYGHDNVWLLDGGSRKWLAEGRPVSLDAPTVEPTIFYGDELGVVRPSKATVENIFESFFNPASHRLLDVRSAAEYSGKIMSPGVGADAKCAVAGHIPTAINVPWSLNCNEDGTFKSPTELKSLYESFDVRPENTVVTYCAIGERASLSWFVLRHLLNYPVVMNYDRSMAQWSRTNNAPIVTGEAA